MLSQLALAVTILLSAAALREPSGVPFQVIVHPTNPVSSLSRAEVSALFMRRTRSWSDGTDVRPIEPPERSPLREPFSRTIHGKSVAYVTRYWHRVIFAGRGVPPEEAESEAEVIELVKNHRGAIGYIARDTPPIDGVKVVAVTP